MDKKNPQQPTKHNPNANPGQKQQPRKEEQPSSWPKNPAQKKGF